MIYTKEVENMCPVAKGAKHEPAPIPEEGKLTENIEVARTSLWLYAIRIGIPGFIIWPAKPASDGIIT